MRYEYELLILEALTDAALTAAQKNVFTAAVLSADDFTGRTLDASSLGRVAGVHPGYGRKCVAELIEWGYLKRDGWGVIFICPNILGLDNL